VTRIPQEEARGEKESIYAKIVVKVKTGTAIDPETGLEDVAYVYQRDGLLNTSVLSFADVQNNKNSYYKLQVLESEACRDYWVFRGWGRIGTKVGDKKLEKFPSAESACDSFETLYEEKSGNMFGFPYKKVHGKYHPVDIDYVIDDKIKKIIEKSKIPSTSSTRCST
jgi:poly [ADP-ribose] polymerase 1